MTQVILTTATTGLDKCNDEMLGIGFKTGDSEVELYLEPDASLSSYSASLYAPIYANEIIVDADEVAAILETTFEYQTIQVVGWWVDFHLHFLDKFCEKHSIELRISPARIDLQPICTWLLRNEGIKHHDLRSMCHNFDVPYDDSPYVISRVRVLENLYKKLNLLIT